MAAWKRSKQPQPDVAAAVLHSAVISPQHREAVTRFVADPSPGMVAEYPELLFPGTISEIQAIVRELLTSGASPGGRPGPPGPEALKLAGMFSAAVHILQELTGKRP
jgi:hypothetical protein